MLLTWLPSYLQTAKGLSVLNAGMLTAVPFGAATVVAIGLGRISDRLLSRDAVHAGRRRSMLAVMLVSAASILLIPFINSLWLIVVVLAVARSMGAAGSALNFALVTDLVRNPADIGKVTSITVLGGNSFGMMGPIVTGYVVGLTGSFNGTFAVAGILALIGAVATLTMTRRPIEVYAAFGRAAPQTHNHVTHGCRPGYDHLSRLHERTARDRTADRPGQAEVTGDVGDAKGDRRPERDRNPPATATGK